MRSKLYIALIVFLLVIVCACTSARQKLILETNASQIRLRSIQTRAFDATDQNAMLRAVIATLQDLEFIIENADADLGTVTGSRNINYREIRLTVSIKPRGANQLMVRSSAQVMQRTIEDPEPYQQFFAALSKALFRDAHQAE